MANMPAFRSDFFQFIFWFIFSIFMNAATKAGFRIKATNNDEDRTTIKVCGKIFINWPIIPSHINSGTKAAKVVKVDEIIGKAISLTPFLVA